MNAVRASLDCLWGCLSPLEGLYFQGGTPDTTAVPILYMGINTLSRVVIFSFDPWSLEITTTLTPAVQEVTTSWVGASVKTWLGL